MHITWNQMFVAEWLRLMAFKYFVYRCKIGLNPQKDFGFLKRELANPA
jgi:hypothetical protein